METSGGPEHVDDAMPPSVASFPAEFGLRARLQAVAPHLTRRMEPIAELLLEQPELAVTLSSRALAARAGVSPPTLTRFCRLLGFTGFAQLRIGAAADAGRSSGQGGWTPELVGVVHPEMNDQELLRTVLATHVQALQASADVMDLQVLRRVADIIVAGRQVDVYGVGGSASVAGGLVERLYQAGVSARAWSDLHLGVMSASWLGSDDIAIAVSSSGASRETIEMLSVARDAGARTIAITSDHRSQLADVAEFVIRTAPPDDYRDLGELTAAHTQVFASDLLYLLVSWHDLSRTADRAGRARNAVERIGRPVRRPG